MGKLVIPCQHGELYPYGDDQLVASTKVAGGVARALKALTFTTLHQDGSDGVDVIFPVDRFEKVAGIMKPRKRRQVSDAGRKRLAVMGAKFRFTPGAQAPETAQFCVPSPQADPEATASIATG